MEASQAKQAERLAQDAPRQWKFRAEDPCGPLSSEQFVDKAGAGAAAQAGRQPVTAHAGREPVAAASQIEAAPAAAPAVVPPAVTLVPQVRAFAAEHIAAEHGGLSVTIAAEHGGFSVTSALQSFVRCAGV